MDKDRSPVPGPSNVPEPSGRTLKRKRSELRETISHGATASQSIGLVRIDPVIFGAYEIHPWFSSPYVLTEPASISHEPNGTTKSPASGVSFAKNGGSKSALGRKPRQRHDPESPGQKDRVKTQPRSSGGRFTANTGSRVVGAQKPQSGRREAAAAPLRLSLRSRDDAGPPNSNGFPGDVADSPDLSSAASTAPLDSPQLAAHYEPSYVAAQRARPPHSGASNSRVPADPSPLSNSLPLPSPSALSPSRSPEPSKEAQSAVVVQMPIVNVVVPSPPAQHRGVRGRFMSLNPHEESAPSKRLAAATAVNGLTDPSAAGGATLLLPEKIHKAGSRGNSPVPQVPSTPTKLYVCDGCFKYIVSPHIYGQHKRSCSFVHPPGRKVYQRGAHIIWEVDGAAARLYCQCLCLFGKLFIDHKYIFFDVEGFTFYVLTEATPSFDHVIGFFSKEKVSYDGYNLACIVTFPPYQKRGFGTLLIEFSYELDRHTRMSNAAMAAANGDGEADEEEEEAVEIFGTPERPLSNLGARGYLSFWTSVLVRYFRQAFEQRRLPTETASAPAAESPVKKVKGFEGEFAKPSPPRRRPGRPRKSGPEPDEIGASGSKASGSGHRPVSLRTTLGDISRATLLRTDDAAFALVQSGLAKLQTERTGKATRAADVDPGHDVRGELSEEKKSASADLEIVVTPELVEEVAERARVKRAVIDRQYLLL